MPKFLLLRGDLKGQCHEIFDFRFFCMNQFPPSLWDYHSGHFKFFRKAEEIFAAQGAPPVSLTPVANEKKIQSEKFLFFFLGHLRLVELTCWLIFSFKFPLLCHQSDIVSIICYRCQWHRWQICHRCRWYRWQISLTPVANLPLVWLTPVANLPPVSTTSAVPVAKCATGVVDTGGAPLLANISANLQIKVEMTRMLFSGDWGNTIHEKNLKLKISWHCPFKRIF